ncbi:metallophosphoesterase family protein [Prosthecomicrobium pneumaticum]|uniref:3',5'-cyclic AMP phosphodiesterase CpdA n=1 Tax=Prosthecomicrobium pneumaticum TaxID=81895 RepID=A0A7W9FLD1_9HYPH|nr:metallophosphoesterase [Prosthecomicrobium pneumaticum]MBB5752786.1 3',5'-cyclic AMP phosphodiesterase CpdA [Prosthecomicrobium pneumaticum]
MFQLAHLSDPHLGPLPKPKTLELASKRFFGYVNWQRNRIKALAGPILADLIEDMRGQAPDHVAVTGDLVNIALPQEIAAAALWLEALGPPHHVSVVPGNHDAYVPGALKAACRAWRPYLLGDEGALHERVTFPFVRRRGPVGLVCLSTAQASAPLMATGTVPPTELDLAGEALARLRAEGLFRVVLIHHPPFKDATAWHKRLIGSGRVRAMLRQHGAELVLHGHTHLDTFVRIDGPDGPIPVVGVPSASNAPGGEKPAARYNLFRIEGEPGAWRCLQVERGYGDEGAAIGTVRERRVA